MLALLVAHLAGDFLLQTDWQAVNKVRGIGDAVARRALGRHLATYSLAFVPVLVWIAEQTAAWRAIVVAVAVIVPHLLIDDGHMVRFWLRRVKGVDAPDLGLTIAVDQSFHVLCLLGAALIAAA
jgi:Protein of unknown function (DUF3307)